MIVFRGALHVVLCPVECLWQLEARSTLVILFRGALHVVQCPVE